MLTSVRQQDRLYFMDKSLFEPLNLSESELTVYTAVLDAGSMTPTALAKATGVKRTTGYSIARNLVEKGLLIEDRTRRPQVFTPATPEHMEALIEAERSAFALREKSLKNLANEIGKVSAKRSYPVPTVRFIEEDKIGAFLRQQTPEWDKSMLEVEPNWWGFNDHTLHDYHGDWLDWYWKRVPDGVGVRLLTNRAPKEVEAGKKYGDRRQMKYFGEVTNFLSSFWITGDYVIMLNTRTHPFYLVEIHDKLMAHDQREVFKNLWPLVQ